MLKPQKGFQMDVCGPIVGVTVPNSYSSAEGLRPGTLVYGSRASDHGPFGISLVNSFCGIFALYLRRHSRDNFKLNRTAAFTEWRQLLSA